jgi:tRNA pseudouridine38-40 synthase
VLRRLHGNRATLIQGERSVEKSSESFQDRFASLQVEGGPPIGLTVRNLPGPLPVFLDVALHLSTFSRVKSDEFRRFRLTLHYDGTYLMGWQLQPRGRTVQGELEDVLRRITGNRYPVLGSGRTDSGVHATGQVAAVTLPVRWDAPELHRALNALLPSDIWVQRVEIVPMHFHPRYHAVARSYRYQVGLAPDSESPFRRSWCWPLARNLDVDLLAAAARLLVGERSFRAFAKSGQEHRGELCHVSKSAWVHWGDADVAFEITANRFLHHMVRYLVGTMVDVGLGRRPLVHVTELLTVEDTELVTSPPAPPEGLFLTAVHYPDPLPELEASRLPAPGEEQR